MNQGNQPMLSMQQYLEQKCDLKFQNGKIICPDVVKRIKLDIGLCYNAPHSQKWLSDEPDLLVFGFEPDISSVRAIVRGGSEKRHPNHGDRLDIKYIKEKRFHVIPCALGAKPGLQKFYITANDHGCSSLYVPNQFPIKDVNTVPVYTLEAFFDVFPFDVYPYIEYMKIDAQGSDLDILKGAGSYLSERCVYVTVEPENKQYKNTDNSESSIDKYMISQNFVRTYDQNTTDPTYLNKKFSNVEICKKIKCYQQG